ncbi:DUF1905 domain-containing protein [Allocoprobacillus halotolerans]|uniref:DUF1905 domain-containing protein n=1 Tax=Allocoprobacillus halotolerans TaxID=2944914 RepID=A0ABY5I3Z9_9FIRM|nr:DUF1905 domain-containing protein [Allocoprobacillus halotolerans]UTY40073.1 DUF1905 domain-containing protein [Allocoprobacillus halotolerans]
MSQIFEFDAQIHDVKDKGGAYVIFPYDIRQLFGKGRLKVHVTFDGIPYDGSMVNMGVKDTEGKVCYIIGMLKSIRNQLQKQPGDYVHVVVTERK